MHDRETGRQSAEFQPMHLLDPGTSSPHHNEPPHRNEPCLNNQPGKIFTQWGGG